MKKYPNQIAVMYEQSEEGSEYMLASEKAEDCAAFHRQERVAIYRLERIVLVKNESRVVEIKKRSAKRGKK